MNNNISKRSVPIYLLIIGIMTLLIFCQCKRSKSEIPKNILPKQEMIDILTECYIIEASLVQLKNKGQTTDDKTPLYYAALFNKFNITKAQFDSSIAFYSHRFNIMDELMNEVIIKINILERECELQKKNSTEN